MLLKVNHIWLDVALLCYNKWGGMDGMDQRVR